MNRKELYDLLDRMAKSWPSEIVARKKVEEFTGGMLTGKTVANWESKGDGPPKLKFGRIAGYPKGPFIEWMKPRFFLPNQKGAV